MSFTQFIHSELNGDYKNLVTNLDHGTVFKKVKTIDNSKGIWNHVFAIPFITEYRFLKGMSSCRKKGNSDTFQTLCQEFGSVMALYKRVTKHLIKDFKLNIDNIKNVLPEDSILIDEILRVRRGLIDLGSEIGYQLFGMARHKDIVALRESLIMIQQQLEQGSTDIMSDINTLQSTQIQLDKRISTLKYGMVTMHEDITNMKSSLDNWTNSIDKQVRNITNHFALEIKHVKQFMGILHAYNVQHLQVISTLHAYSFRMLSAVQTLLQGLLPIQIVPPKDLQKVLESVSGNLLKSLPSFKITHNHIAYYYAHKLVSFAHSPDFLYIRLKIPITSGNTNFDVYSVNSLPMPVISNKTHGITEIIGHSKYLAVSSDHLLYAELNELGICSDEVYSRCPEVIVPVERTIHSCTSALFYNDAAGIRKLCKHQFTPNIPDSFFKVISLGQNDFIISAMPQRLVLNCPQKPSVELESLPITRITLGCDCTLQSNYFFIPAAASDCQNASSKSQLDNTNVNLLKRIYKTALPLNFSAPKLNENGQLEFEMPEFKVFESDWEQVLEKDNLVTYDLEKIKTALNGSHKYFATKHDEVMYRLNSIGKHFVLQSGVTFSSLYGIIHIMSIISIIYLFVQYRNLKTKPNKEKGDVNIEVKEKVIAPNQKPLLSP